MATTSKIQKKYKYIHVLNKFELGGVQSIVESICKLNNKEHFIWYLAGSKLTHSMLKRKFFRISIFVLFTLKLVFTIKLRRSTNCIFIFHLAEPHYIFKLLNYFINTRKNENLFVCYFYQSPQLYPKKLINRIKKWENTIDYVIFYSRAVKLEWEKTYFQTLLREGKSSVIHNLISKNFAPDHKTKKFDNSLQIVHIGRKTHWKDPEKVITIASKLADKKIPVTVSFLGIKNWHELRIDKREFINYRNLKVNFCKAIRTSPNFYKPFHLMVYLPKPELSIETVGVAAMEAISCGIPVVVSQKNTSDYKRISSVIDFEGFEEFVATRTKPEIKIYLNKFLKIAATEKKSIFDRYSAENYVIKLESICSSAAFSKNRFRN